MENYFIYNDPIRIVWRKGDSSEPYVDKVESQKVINNMVVLTEIPDEFTHVSISGYTEIYEGTPSTNQFIVNYENGIITFHASKEGTTITNMTYKGRGFILYPASRIYGHNDNPDVTITLQQIIDAGDEALEALAELVIAIANAEAATATAITQAAYAKTQGDYAKAQGDYGKAQGDYAKAAGDALVFKGTYAAGTAYVARNMVYYNGATYMAIASTTGNLPTNITYWKKIGSMVWKGVYSTATAYTYGDFVVGASGYTMYMSISETNTNQLLTNTSYWSPMITVQSVVDLATTATTNANTATTNANEAKDAANTATGLANTATTNANTATTNANAARDAANTAATAANTAKTNADTARDAANAAASAANTAKTNADTATGLANTATTNANTARDAANAAATAANTAKTNADTATANANTAKDAANTAATNANTQATFAQTQGDYAKAAGDSLVHKGDYSASTVYVPRNMVYYNGCTYMCILTTTAGTLPTNTTNWRKIVAFNWKGTYSSATTYQYGDFVMDATSQKMYLCIKDATLNIVLTTVANWAPILDISAIVSAATTATTNANNATTAANTAKTNADIATESANDAATSANNAATAANTAKTNADTATGLANTATANTNAAITAANSLVSRTTAKGAYSASTTYYPNNVVTYNGSSYMCTVQALNKVPTDTGFWQLLALKGNDGTGSVVGLASANSDIVIAGTVQTPDLSISASLKSLWNDKYTKTEVDALINQVTSGNQWKTSVANFAAIATTYPNPQDGWTVNVNDTDYTYRYTGTEWVVISANSIPNASSSTDGKMSATLFNKLTAITAGANRVLHSTTNGNILIDGVENNVYLHPTGAGNNHIPAGGSANNFLKYSASGVATWATPTLAGLAETIITSPVAGNVLRYNGAEWINSVLQFSDIGTWTSTGQVVQMLNADMLDSKHAADFMLLAGGTMTGATQRQYGSTSYKRFDNIQAMHLSANTTGTLKITLPVSWTSSMLNIKLTGYDYARGNAWELMLGGYNYISSASWIATNAIANGLAPFTSVRFAHDGTKCCILLGTTSTAWNIQGIEISSVTASWIGYNAALATGWTMEIITSETGITVSSTPVLNAGTSVDMVDGYHADYNATPSTLMARGAGGEVFASIFASTIPDGTPPLSVTSKSLVFNLNAQYLNGTSGSAVATANTLVLRDVNGDTNLRRLGISVATGTSPFVVQSTTLNTNLNADLLDSYHAADFVLRTDNEIYRIGSNGDTPYFLKIAEMTTSVGSGAAGLTLMVEGTASFGSNRVGVDLIQMSTRTGSTGGPVQITPLAYSSGQDATYGIVVNATSGMTELWMRRAGYNYATKITVGQKFTNGYTINVGILINQAAQPAGYTAVARTTTDADMVDGFHASATSAINTVAVRDASGYLWTKGIIVEGTSVPPIQVDSTMRVPNLNVDMVDGFHASTVSTPNTIVVQDSLGAINVSKVASSTLRTGNFVQKHLGAFVTTQNVANEKVDIVFSGMLSGYFDIVLTSNYGWGQAYGQLRKRFSIYTGSTTTGTIYDPSSAYVETMGYISLFYAISDMFYDSASQTFRIRISKLSTANGNTVQVYLEGMGGMDDRANALETATLSAIITSDTSTPAAPVRTFIRATAFSDQVTLGVAQGTAPLQVTSTSLNTNLNADMVDNYHATTTNTVSAIVVRDSNGIIQASRGYFLAPQGTIPLQITSTTLVSNLNADLVDNYHVSMTAAANTIPVRNASGYIDEVVPQKTISATLPATAGWYRIATSTLDINRNAARFELDWTVSGVHGQVTFNAGIMYGTDPTLNQIMYTTYFAAGITKARIVYHTTYTGNYAYVEVYNAGANAVVINTQMVSTMGWSLITPVAGSIPSGYTTSELTFVDGISTDGVLSSQVATGTAPLVINSTTAVPNLNVDLHDGYHAILASTVNSIPVRDSNKKIAEVASNRVVTNDTQVSITYGTVASYSVVNSAAFTVKFCLRVTSSTAAIRLTVSYTGQGGAKTVIVIPPGTYFPADDHYFVPVVLRANNGTTINVQASTSISGTAWLTTIITEEG